MSFTFTGITIHTLGRKTRKTPVPRMLCIRPKNPALAIAGAKAALTELGQGGHVDTLNRRYQAVLDSQPYTFVGYMRQPVQRFPDGSCQIENFYGDDRGRSQPGDFFVLATPENVKEANQAKFENVEYIRRKKREHDQSR